MIIYLFLLILLVVLFGFRYFVINKKSYDIIVIKILYVFFVLVASVRFSTGTDYLMYASIFSEVNNFQEYFGVDVNNVFGLEPGYLYLNEVWGWSRYGYFGVLSTVSFITMFYLYKAGSLLPSKWQYFCLFIMLTNAFYFISLNQVRQATSIAIYLYSLRFIEKEKFKFIIINLVSVLMFHYSAIIVFLSLFFVKLKVSDLKLFSFMMITLVLSYFNVFHNLLTLIFSYIPLYKMYEGSDYMSGAGVSAINIVTTLFFAIVLSFFSKRNYLHYLFALGICLSLCFSNVALFQRAALYFIYIKIILLPYILIDLKYKSNFNIIICLFIFYSMLMFFYSLYINSGGVIPYKTFFDFL